MDKPNIGDIVRYNPDEIYVDKYDGGYYKYALMILIKIGKDTDGNTIYYGIDTHRQKIHQRKLYPLYDCDVEKFYAQQQKFDMYMAHCEYVMTVPFWKRLFMSDKKVKEYTYGLYLQKDNL